MPHYKYNVGRSDSFQTPIEDIDFIVRWLGFSHFIGKTVWDPCCGKGNIVNYFLKHKIQAAGTDIADPLTPVDFLDNKTEPVGDLIFTNPPYSLKTQFIKKCYELNKPFALLMPITALAGTKRQPMFKQNGIQIIIPEKRINFETPSGKPSKAWFATAWFTKGFNLKKDLNFV